MSWKDTFQASLHQVLRSTGLGSFNKSKQVPSSKNSNYEEKKVIVTTSRWVATTRCAIHVLPVLVSSIIILVNTRQVFIGIDFPSLIRSETINIALLQTIAKLQELLITASLATIIFQLVRDELLYGGGLPLGLLGAGLNFTKLSFFWSPEFIGSIKALLRGRRRYRKIQLGCFLLLAGALALLAGPSCAVLLVPQNQEWPAGSTPIYLNDSMHRFWPVTVKADSLSYALCNGSEATEYTICPAGGFTSIRAHFSGLDRESLGTVVPSFADELSGNHYYWTVGSEQPISTRTMILSQPTVDPFFIQPQLSTAILLNQITRDWWTALLNHQHIEKNNIQDRQAQSSQVLNSYVRVLCAPGKILGAEEYIVDFPTFDEAHPSREVDMEDNIGWAVPAGHTQFSWQTLTEEFSSVSTGAVLQSKWTHDKSSRFVVTCSVQARWVPAHVRTDAYSFWQGWYPKNVTFESAYPSKGGRLLNSLAISDRDAIRLDQTWLELLTPKLPIAGQKSRSSNMTTIESILNDVKLLDALDPNDFSIDDWQTEEDSSSPALLASVIGTIMSDGLSRIDVAQMFRQEGDPAHWITADYGKAPDFESLLFGNENAVIKPVNAQGYTTLNVQFSISGLSYRRTMMQWFAMAVLLIHMAIAVSHTVWTISRATTSSSWNTLTEMLVLAQNSTPAYDALRNTAAGIQDRRTFAKNIWIGTAYVPGSLHADHVEFVYDERERQLSRKYKPNTASSPQPRNANEYLNISLKHGTASYQSSVWSSARGRSSGGQSSQSLATASSELGPGSRSPSPLLRNPLVSRGPTSGKATRVTSDCLYG